MNTFSRMAMAVALGLALDVASVASAQEHHGPDRGPGPARGPDQHFAARPDQRFAGRPGPGGPHQFFDNRYNHGGYYPNRGYVVRDLPGGYRPYYWHGNHYYFAGGVWYAPGPAGFVVTGAPVGLAIATLPPVYTTVWLGGTPYYYADNVYYQWNAPQNSYVVADVPNGADQPGGPPPDAASPGAPGAPSDNAYIYPKNGQTQDQQAADRFECHDWAKNQTGFDPTQPSGGVDPSQTGPRRDQYQRAMSACLEARGYTVR
jgi:hypothetical protein